MKIKGILFDKDGTLIEFQGLWHQIMTAVLQNLALKYSVDSKTVAGIEKISGYEKERFARESMIQYATIREIVKVWVDYLKRAGEDEVNTINEKLLLDMFEEHSLNDELCISTLEGAPEVLDYLKQRNYYLGIATADTYQSAVHSLKKAGIYSYFHFIGADDGGLKAKPHPQMAELFCEQHGFKTEELLIVGDSLGDMEFARNAGARFIGIKTAYNAHEEFEKSKVKTVEKIKDILAAFSL